MLEKVIKISNKSFDDLTQEELALMIEADSSLSHDGNEYFSSCALDEFLAINYLENEEIIRLQKYIRDNIYVAKESGKKSSIDTTFLKKLAVELRAGRIRLDVPDK